MVDWPSRANVKRVLFLCTGNYYRSRFAEELFNHEAERAGLDWIAKSRGLALERGANNVGPIAPVVLHALKELTISARGADRFPQQCTVDDLAGADFVVAVKETEIRHTPGSVVDPAVLCATVSRVFAPEGPRGAQEGGREIE